MIRKFFDSIIQEIMADISGITFIENFAGIENHLNHVLSTFVDSEHEAVNSWKSPRYIDMSDIKSVFQQTLSDFHILSLNVQNIEVKFDNLIPTINDLSASGLYFGAFKFAGNMAEFRC